MTHSDDLFRCSGARRWEDIWTSFEQKLEYVSDVNKTMILLQFTQNK